MSVGVGGGVEAAELKALYLSLFTWPRCSRAPFHKNIYLPNRRNK